MVDFSNHMEARKWFEMQPREVDVTMAARISLRVLPLIFDGQSNQPPTRFNDELILLTFRATAVSWAVANFPANGELRSKAAAARAASDRIGLRVSASRPQAASLAAATEAAAAAAARPTRAMEALVAAHGAATNPGLRGGDAMARAAAAEAATEAAAAAKAAAQADAYFIEAGTTAAERGRLAVELAKRPLWPDAMPLKIGNAWGQLRDYLQARNEHWDVWTAWFEDRLAGQPGDPDLELKRVMLADALWDEGPRAVNTAIRHLANETPGASMVFAAPFPPEPERVGEPIPPQGAGPHFTLGATGPITLSPPSDIDAEGNNLGRIRQLLPLARRAADDLLGHLNPNQFRELSRDVADYRAAIADDTAIAWGTVFGLGVMLENAALAAERQLDDPLWPRLEDAVKASLISLLALHGPLILATAEGRELADEADRMRLTRDQQAALRPYTEPLSKSLSQDRRVIENSAAELVEKAVETIGEGPHAERGTVFGLAAIKNVSIVLVGAAAAAAAAGAVGVWLGPAAGTGAGWLSLEALKKSKVFLTAVEALGGEIDRLVKLGEDQADLARVQLIARLNALAPFRDFVIRNEEALRRIAENTTQMRWMLSYIDFIVRPPAADPFLTEGPEWEDDNYWTWQPGDPKLPKN